MTCLVAPPFITKQPTNQKIIALQDVTFAFEAKGFGVIYIWKRHKNSTTISIGKRSSLTISKVTPLDEDQYYCVARTRGGYAFTNNATLKVDGKSDNVLANCLKICD